ncbi:hypothetical protein [Sinomonas sp. P47F7]|uniref:hypothetical protein n=1 Tax=Sinomonas sp. P47F7 TaxID=3410987 RepID=UPI003BF4AC05
MTDTRHEIQARYRSEVLQWAASHADPKRANQLFRSHHAFYKSIRDLPEGREALLTLLEDESLPVRVMAATHVLPFAPDRGVPVLEEAERAGDVMSIDAKYTLISFRSGKLNLDW